MTMRLRGIGTSVPVRVVACGLVSVLAVTACSPSDDGRAPDADRTPSFGEDAIDFDRMRDQALAFGDIAVGLDDVPVRRSPAGTSPPASSAPRGRRPATSPRRRRGPHGVVAGLRRG
jgi:hypothetical protein